MSDVSVDKLQQIAKAHNGHCDRCGRVIKIYKYKMNAGMASTLRTMARIVSESGDKVINFNTVKIPYSQATQRTKMRLHGLIAKHKVNGKQVRSEWVITHKGWAFLAGQEIDLTVIVFDDQVLGHTGGLTSIKRLTGIDSEYEEEPISTVEAGVYHDVRKVQKGLTYRALYKGRYSKYEKDTVYTVKINRLVVGESIVMTEPDEMTYRDIAAFQHDWKIIKEVK